MQVGFREWIFSDVSGALGTFAAAAEFAFGTIVQRTMSYPGRVRMHYGERRVVLQRPAKRCGQCCLPTCGCVWHGPTRSLLPANARGHEALPPIPKVMHTHLK